MVFTGHSHLKFHYGINPVSRLFPDTVIKEDDKEISRSRERHVVRPFVSIKGEDGKWTHTDTDISKEASEVQAIANAAWTDTVKTNYKAFIEAQKE